MRSALEQYKHFFARRSGLTLLAVNVIGAIVYVVRASAAWAIPQEHGEVPITGEPFVWFLGIMPVVIVFLLLNLFWGAMLLNRRWRNGYFWLMSAAVWFIAVWIDFAHH